MILIIQLFQRILVDVVACHYLDVRKVNLELLTHLLNKLFTVL